MTERHWEVLVEDISTEAALRILLPKVLGDATFTLHSFLDKEQMLKRLPERLRGYAARRRNDAWFKEHCRIAILIDRDDDDCIELKARIEAMASQARLVTRRSTKDGLYVAVTRIAIEELEAWYFGDWEAVRAAYPRVDANIPAQKAYRAPDSVSGGTWEAFERVLQRAGYFKTGLRKIEAARAVATHLDPSRNQSPSFNAFCSALSDG